MTKIYTIFLIVLCGILLTAFEFSFKPDPNEKRWGKAEVIVHIVDENGKPLSGVVCDGNFQDLYFRQPKHRAITDSKGLYILKGKIQHSGVIGFNKIFYYPSVYYFEYKKSKNKDGSWNCPPFNQEIAVIMRPIKEPIMTWSGNISEDDFQIPDSLFHKEFGFDFLKGDWIYPYGKGEIADCFFKTLQNEENHITKISLSFRNKKTGIQDMNGRTPYSSFASAYHAPDSGYQQEIIFDPRKNHSFYIKLKNRLPEIGEFYGRIDKFSFHVNRCTMNYTINPDGTTNMESDQRLGRWIPIGQPWKPLERGARGDLKIKIVDPEGKPIEGLNCSFRTIQEDCFPQGGMMDFITNQEGMSPLYHNWVYRKMELIIRPSDKVHSTEIIVQYPDTLRYDETGKQVWKPWVDTIVATPKMKIKPVKPKETRFKADFTPLPGMRLPYDILMNKPVHPYGDGKVTDCYLSGTRKLASDTEYEYTMTLEFAKPWEGIKPRPPVVEPPNFSSKFKGEYKIPEDGFQSKWTFTKRLRRDKSVSDRFLEDYYIRFRTKKDAQGRVTKGEFGTFGCYFVDFHDNGLMYFSASLFLNPDGENNIEFVW